MFDYLFFDLDGTLTDPAEGIINSFIHALKFYGIEIPSYEKLCTYIGPPLPATFRNEYGFSQGKQSAALYFGAGGVCAVPVARCQRAAAHGYARRAFAHAGRSGRSSGAAVSVQQTLRGLACSLTSIDEEKSNE